MHERQFSVWLMNKRARSWIKSRKNRGKWIIGKLVAIINNGQQFTSILRYITNEFEISIKNNGWNRVSYYIVIPRNIFEITTCCFSNLHTSHVVVKFWLNRRSFTNKAMKQSVCRHSIATCQFFFTDK